ncbi:hypothetical protein BH09SUM1_BH09SUM1_31370 [soil metagenome]
MSDLRLSAVTGIGSLPFHEPAEAIAFVRRWCPAIPFWPQLPKSGMQEMMTSQFIADGLDQDFAFSQHFHSGWFAFLDALREGKFPDAVAIKGHLAGPQTMAQFLRNADDAESIARRTEELISAQLDALLPFHDRVIIQLDEPAAKEPPYDALATAIGFIRARGGIPMVHCCAPLTREFVQASEGAILSFDIHINGPGGGLLDAIQNHVRSGGGVAWGAAPTKDERDLDSCSARLKEWRTALSVIPVVELITATCGLGTVLKREGKESFEIAHKLVADL